LQALAYFEQLKSSDTGWQLAISTLTSSAVNQSLDDYAKFFCLQVIEVYSKCQYIKADPSQQQAMKNFLSQWIQIQARYCICYHFFVMTLLSNIKIFAGFTTNAGKSFYS